MTAASLISSPTVHAASAPRPPINRAALGAGGGAFCDLLRSTFIDSYEGRRDLNLSNPAKVKAYYEKINADATKILAAAPPALANDMKETSKVTFAFFAELKRVNFDLKKMNMTAVSALSSSNAFTAAEARLQTYFVKTCHIDQSKLFAAAPPPPPTKKKP